MSIWGPGGGGGASYLAGVGLLLTGLTFSINTTITADLTTIQTMANKTLTAPKITALGVGDLLIGGAANAVSSLPDVAVNQVLVSGGVGVAPAWSGTPTVSTLTAINSISCGTVGSLIERFGNGASANNFGTALGASANATATGVGAALAVGAGTSATFARSMSFGVGATTTADGQIVFCVNDSAMTSSVFFGNNTVNASPAGTSVNATGGSGANVGGAAFGINGGRGTGTGAGGPVTVSTAKAGASSSTLNNRTERLRVDSLGNLNFNSTVAGATAERVLVLGNANVVAPTASVDLVQFYAVDLSAGNCTLGLFTERAVAVDAAAVSTHSLSVVINGTTFRLLLATP